MRVTAIIAEYNPFHNGHAYQLAQAREQTQADYLVVVMSGNYVQRGAPALLERRTRARMALMSGADLVLALPALWSCASAEYFAGAGIALLSQLGIVDTLCYGCENENVRLMDRLSEILNEEPPDYKQALQLSLSEGISYPRAREQAVLSLLPESEQENARPLLEHPNNILALEYHKAIRRQSADIACHPILRVGQSYSSADATTCLSSATGIRSALQGGARPVSLSKTMPPSSFRLLMDYSEHAPLLFEEDLSSIVHYALLLHADEGYEHFADCTLDFSHRLQAHLNAYTGYSAFCTQLKCKDLAYTRISRCLLHILLGHSRKDYLYWKSHGYAPYIQVLGFRRDASSLLGLIRERCAMPLVVRTSDLNQLSPEEEIHRFVRQEEFANNLYHGLSSEKSGQPQRQESRRQVVVV